MLVSWESAQPSADRAAGEVVLSCFQRERDEAVDGLFDDTSRLGDVLVRGTR